MAEIVYLSEKKRIPEKTLELLLDAIDNKVPVISRDSKIRLSSIQTIW
ncbi:MAG: hypothetical protein QNJ41_18720 [Xenococcaceae cyanobacterium MO_188.B32]|nr:hypothetical protein [Xenococcaceae cyanobacterium MO_188.B32]